MCSFNQKHELVDNWEALGAKEKLGNGRMTEPHTFPLSYSLGE
jgi:hypothetical protein